ncbi:DnaD domain protein [Niallia oryzisoli]|uniref:DnaD domain protein n=1 Tax=Niallia oryzisoli TaxID=1737571 RepID=A0ABZ2CB79_9BACI
MNYVQEISSFYSWLELNPLTPSSINLWHALMHMHVKAGGSETFSVAESVLCIRTNLTDRTLRKARKELKEKGRIDYVSRHGKAPVYRIIPFQSWDQPQLPQQTAEEPFEKISPPCAENDTTPARSSESNSEVCTGNSTNQVQASEKNSDFHSKHHSTSETIAVSHSEPLSSSENTSAICSTLFRQQQTDTQQNKVWSDVIETWKSVFGFTLKPNHIQILNTYINVSKMSESLILEAIERVKQASKPVLNYLWTILSNGLI